MGCGCVKHLVIEFPHGHTPLKRKQVRTAYPISLILPKIMCQLQTNVHHCLLCIVGQAVNPCLWCRVCFAHPHLQHGFKDCRGLCLRTPGCIPILVLDVLIPNNQSLLSSILISVFTELYPNISHRCFDHLSISSVYPSVHICPSVPSVHLFCLSTCSCLSICSCLSTCSHLFICSHLSICSHPVLICPSLHLFHLFICSHPSIHSHLSTWSIC